MKLYFSNEKYKEKALGVHKFEKSNHSVGEAFMLLIKDVSKEDLSNLTEMIKEHFTLEDLSLDDCYNLTQGKSTKGIEVNEELKSTMVNLAYECIENGKSLGEKTINDGKINTSSWMSHVLYEGKLAKELALKLGIDETTAQIQGILHDYGRKVTHSFEHVTRGYEKLVDEGWEQEAVSALTHSFLNGGRCASNEQAEEGFYIDENGNPAWKEGTEKDDITLFLENYEYSKYDDILNIADLMATSNGIVSPYDRIQDIATRRKLDPTNRGYFLAEFTNKLVEVLKETGAELPENMQTELKATPDVNIEELNEKFKSVSDIFYNFYKENISLDSKKNQVSLDEVAEVANQSTKSQLMSSEKQLMRLVEKENNQEIQK